MIRFVTEVYDQQGKFVREASDLNLRGLAAAKGNLAVDHSRFIAQGRLYSPPDAEAFLYLTTDGNWHFFLTPMDGRAYTQQRGYVAPCTSPALMNR